MYQIPEISLNNMDAIIFILFLVLSVVSMAFHYLAKNTDQRRQSISNANFLTFQRSFFAVYFLALLGDWLQGPYVYKLYDYYGFKEFQIAVLYVAGFASSVVFGTATGPLADMIGRRKMATAFCVTYILCCVTKLSGSYWILMIGRLLGGISTSMLFSTFEAWYVYEHTERHGFPNEWMGATFSITTFWNGMLAILSGVVANFAAEGLGFGPVAPFVVACFPLTLCGVIVINVWDENYGNRKPKFMSNCLDGLKVIFSDQSVLLLGGVQSMVESCMYIFVFLWTPVLMPWDPPLGMVFACFMLAIMIGSSIYTLLQSRGFRPENVLKICLVIISASMAGCSYAASPDISDTKLVIIYASFFALEVAIGIYFPAMSFAKSQVIPESHRANVMNWFRVPMNVITCSTLLCLHIEWVAADKRIVFAVCLAMAISGVLMASHLEAANQKRRENNKDFSEEQQSFMYAEEET